MATTMRAIAAAQVGSARTQQSPSMPAERLTYTVNEVAVILGLSRTKTYELVSRGEIPVVPLSGRRRLIARLTVERLLAGAAETG